MKDNWRGVTKKAEKRHMVIQVNRQGEQPGKDGELNK